MYDMKNELESVVYNQSLGFHRAFQIWQFVMKFNLKFQSSIQSSALHYSLAVRRYGNYWESQTDKSHVFLKELHQEYKSDRPEISWRTKRV